MSLTLAQKGGKYADMSCNILVLSSTRSGAAAIEGAEEAAELLFKNATTFLHVEPEDAATTKILPGKVYKLEVDATKTSTTFTLAGIVEQSEHKANYIIFSEHMLSEFEGDAGHYLKFGKKDIEATAEEPSHEAHAAPAPSPAGNNAGTIATSMAAVAVAIAATLFR